MSYEELVHRTGYFTATFGIPECEVYETVRMEENEETHINLIARKDMGFMKICFIKVI